MQLLESIDPSYKETKRVLQDKKKFFTVGRWILKRLVYLLRPFQHIITVIQRGNEPSLYVFSSHLCFYLAEGLEFLRELNQIQQGI